MDGGATLLTSMCYLFLCVTGVTLDTILIYKIHANSKKASIFVVIATLALAEIALLLLLSLIVVIRLADVPIYSYRFVIVFSVCFHVAWASVSYHVVYLSASRYVYSAMAPRIIEYYQSLNKKDLIRVSAGIWLFSTMVVLGVTATDIPPKLLNVVHTLPILLLLILYVTAGQCRCSPLYDDNHECSSSMVTVIVVKFVCLSLPVYYSLNLIATSSVSSALPEFWFHLNMVALALNATSTPVLYGFMSDVFQWKSSVRNIKTLMEKCAI